MTQQGLMVNSVERYSGALPQSPRVFDLALWYTRPYVWASPVQGVNRLLSVICCLLTDCVVLLLLHYKLFINYICFIGFSICGTSVTFSVLSTKLTFSSVQKTRDMMIWCLVVTKFCSRALELDFVIWVKSYSSKWLMVFVVEHFMVAHLHFYI